MSIERNLLGSFPLTSQPGSDPSPAACRPASGNLGEYGIQKTTATKGSVSAAGAACPKCELAGSKECPGCLTKFCQEHLIECSECPEQMCSECLSAHSAEGHWSDFRTNCERAQSITCEPMRPANHALEHRWRVERLRQHLSAAVARTGNAAAAQQLQSCIYIAIQCAVCGEWRMGLAGPPEDAEVACPVCARPCAFTVLAWGLTSRALPFHEQFIAKEAFDSEGGRRIPWDDLPLAHERQFASERQGED